MVIVERGIAGLGHGVHAGECPEPIHHLLLEERGVCVVITLAAQLEGNDRDIFHLVSGIDGLRQVQPMQQQTGSDQQNHGDGYLHAHQHVAEKPIRGFSTYTGSLFESRVHVRPRGFERRRQPENNSSQERHQQRVTQNADIRADTHCERRHPCGR